MIAILNAVRYAVLEALELKFNSELPEVVPDGVRIIGTISFHEATMVVSLHRLHLLPQFDRIICLSHGKIIADGETVKLLNTDGPVRELWQKHQSHALKRRH